MSKMRQQAREFVCAGKLNYPNVLDNAAGGASLGATDPISRTRKREARGQ